MRETMVRATIEALKSTKQNRFYMTERGCHGRFYCALYQALQDADVLSEDLILEIEYQKQTHQHHTAQRPDIVLHIPVEHSGEGRAASNFAVWALKHARRRTEIPEDFSKPDAMFEFLSYSLGFIVAIDSEEHMLGSYRGRFRDRIMSFAVRSSRESISIRRAFFRGDRLIVNDVTA